MFETIGFKDTWYPKLQAEGFASQYAFKFAEKFLPKVGVIYDIGFSKDDWKYPGAIGIDNEQEFNAMNLPPLQADGIFNSHVLEHLPDYVGALNYWNSKLKYKGVLFCYLPNADYQRHWRPTSNRKHLHHMNPFIMKKYFEETSEIWGKWIVTEGYDLNGSFYCVSEKR